MSDSSEAQDTFASPDMGRLRWRSSPDSVENGTPSVLAIVETLVAITVSVWFAVHFDTYKFIAMSACIAPFLLLRTEESTEHGIMMFDRAVVSIVRWFEGTLDVRNYWIALKLLTSSRSLLRVMKSAFAKFEIPNEDLRQSHYSNCVIA